MKKAEVMGITQVDPREAERCEEGMDLEYHDASENPLNPETTESTQASSFSHGVVVVHHCVNALHC